MKLRILLYLLGLPSHIRILFWWASFVLCAGLLFGSVSDSHSGKTEELAQLKNLEQKVLCSEHLKNGDYNELVDEWFDFIQAKPDHPMVELILRSLPTVMNYCSGDAAPTSRRGEPRPPPKASLAPKGGRREVALIDRVNRILAKDIQNPTNKLLLKHYLVSLYEKQGHWVKQKQLASTLGFINQWAFIGPWGFTNLSTFDEPFPPEEKILLEKTYKNKHYSLSWRILPESFPGDSIDFFSFCRPSAHGAVYGVTQFHLPDGSPPVRVGEAGEAGSPQSNEAWLIIRSDRAYKIWLNGDLIFKADRLRLILPYEITLPVRLSDGWNRLMVKTTSGLGNFFTAQLVKPTGAPFDDLVFEPELKLHPLVKTETPHHFYPAPPLSGAVKYYTELIAKQSDSETGTNPSTPTVIASPSGAKQSQAKETSLRAETKQSQASEIASATPRNDRRGTSLAMTDGGTARNDSPKDSQHSPPNPYLFTTLGLLYRYLGDADQALHLCQQAVDLKPDSPYLTYYLAECYKNSDLLPFAYARNRVKELSDKIIQLEPNFLPVYLARAEYYLSLDKPEAALAELKQSCRPELVSGFWAGYSLAADICSAEGWKYEAEHLMAQLNEISPDNLKFLAYQAESYERQQNYPAALVLYQKIQPHQSSVRWNIRSLYRRMGQLDRVIQDLQQILKYKPAHLPTIRYLARTYTEQGDYQAALKAYQQLTKLVPEDDTAYEKMGDVYLRQGNQSAGFKYYQTALRLNPSNSQLRRYLKFLMGQDKADVNQSEDFSKPYLIDVKKLIPGAPAAKGEPRQPPKASLVPKGGRRDARQFPKADIVYLLDQAVLRIYEDGSYSEFIHQAYKILNERGIDKYSIVNAPGEILEARTYLPHGEIMEPVYLGGGLGSHKLTMPRVELGSIIEYKYRNDVPCPYDGQFRFPRFYFQDPEFNAPFLISQYVIIVPRDFPLKIAQRSPKAFGDAGNLSLKPTIKHLSDPAGDLRVYTWTVTESPRLEPEPHMPHINELLPYVMVAEARDWDDIHKIYQSRFAGLRRCITTELIRSQAKKIIASCQGGEKAGEGRVHTEPLQDERVPSLKEKVEAFYYFVNQEIKEGSGGRTAHEILLTKKGERLILLKALLDAAGIESHFVLVRAPAPLAPEPEWEIPRPEYFTGEGSAGTLLRVPLENSTLPCTDPPAARGEPRLRRDGKAGIGTGLYLSGDYRYLICGDLPMAVQGGKGFLIGRATGKIITIPKLPPESQSSSTELNFTVKGESSTEVTGLIIFRGMANARSKESFSMMDEKSRLLALERGLNNHFPGLKLTKAVFHHLHQPASSSRRRRGSPLAAGGFRQPLRLEFSFSLPHFITKSSQGKLHCKLGLNPLNLTKTFISERVRKLPLQLTQDFYSHDKINIILPASPTRTGGGPPHLLPKKLPASVNLATSFGTYSLTVSTSPHPNPLPGRERGNKMIPSPLGGEGKGEGKGEPAGQAGVRGKVIELERIIWMPAQSIAPDQYPAFIEFCKKIDQTELGRIELRKVRSEK